jgi:hypothetical protein
MSGGDLRQLLVARKKPIRGLIGAFRWDHMDGFHSSRPEPCGGSLMLTENSLFR